MTIEQHLDETVSFLQEFVEQVDLGLSISKLSDDDFEKLARSNDSVLNWRGKYQYFLHDDSFHLGFRLDYADNLDGAMLGVYATTDGHLHILLLESFVRQSGSHPLAGRLTTLVVIAATYFLSLFPDSKGAFVVEPHPDLVEHYERFGFVQVSGDKPAMYASVEALEDVQSRLASDL